MKTMKKMLLFATAAITAMAIAGPASASAAEWALPELDETAETTYSGSIHFQLVKSSAGITCSAEAGVALKPGDTGSIEQLELGSCEGTGNWDLYGCDSGEGIPANLPWGLKGHEKAIDLNYLNAEVLLGEECSLELVNLLAGSAVFGSPIHLTPDNPQAIGALTLSGNGTIEAFGNYLSAKVSGSLEAGEPGAYGIGVGDRWITTDPKPLGKPASVEVAGSLGWEGSWGNGIECTDVQGTATLLPGDEAEVGELDVTPASCHGYGSLLNGCKVKAAYAGNEGTVEATGAGSVHFSELWLTMTGIEGCAKRELGYASAWGEVDAIPDNPSQISKLAINEYVSIETAYGLGGGEMRGSLNVLPAGKYGISG